MGQRRLTGVQMTVEMDNGDRSVRSVDGTEKGKRDSMITAKSDDSRQSLSITCWTDPVRVCHGRS